MMDVDERKVEADIKPEYVVSSSSVYDPIKNEEETDNEDMCNNTNTSKHSTSKSKKSMIRRRLRRKMTAVRTMNVVRSMIIFLGV